MSWDDVDTYIESHLVEQDDALRDAAGGIAVSPAQGKLLHLLAKSVGATRVLELGTLHGYSTIWLARALPEGGTVTTIELDEDNAKQARANIDAAGVGESVEILVGPAADRLADLTGLFDFIFLDADKAGMPEYFTTTLELTRPGSIIICDNTVRDGAVLDEDSDDATIVGVRRLYEVIGGEERVDATGIQTVGAKGYDGFVLARVREKIA